MSVANNTAFAISVASGGHATVSYSDFWNNGGAPFVGMTDPTGTSGNITANPLFASTSGTDSSTWALHLQGGSPLVNAGDPSIVDPGGARVIGYYGGPFAPSRVLSFAPEVTYGGTNYPTSVATADFNGDGFNDLVVVNDHGNTIGVLLGVGDGTFHAPVSYTAGSYPVSVAIGDFDGDAKRDLAVANNGSADVSILLGNGNGTFRAAVNYPAGSRAHAVATADLNGDGRLDLAVTKRQHRQRPTQRQQRTGILLDRCELPDRHAAWGDRNRRPERGRQA